MFDYIEIESAPAVNRWISVEDRLPDIGQETLVVNRWHLVSGEKLEICLDRFIGGRGEMEAFYQDGDKSGHPTGCAAVSGWDWCHWSDVTHWMPLPEAPDEY